MSEPVVNSLVLDPTLTDITRIPILMGDIKSLSVTVAGALLVLLLILEVIRQNLLALEGKNEFTNLFTRLGLVIGALVMYEKIFEFLMGTATTMEYAILSLDDWGSALQQIGWFYAERKPTVASIFHVVMAWLASFFAIHSETILEWLRLALLAVLYFLGPIFLVCGIYRPTAYLVGAWFRNVIQISMWIVVLKSVAKVFLALKMAELLQTANTSRAYGNIVAIDGIFFLMVVMSPVFTSLLVNAQPLGAFSTAMSSLVSARTISALKVVGNSAWKQGTARIDQVRLTGIPMLKNLADRSKTALRSTAFRARGQRWRRK